MREFPAQRHSTHLNPGQREETPGRWSGILGRVICKDYKINLTCWSSAALIRRVSWKRISSCSSAVLPPKKSARRGLSSAATRLCSLRKREWMETMDYGLWTMDGVFVETLIKIYLPCHYSAFLAQICLGLFHHFFGYHGHKYASLRNPSHMTNL